MQAMNQGSKQRLQVAPSPSFPPPSLLAVSPARNEKNLSNIPPSKPQLPSDIAMSGLAPPSPSIPYKPRAAVAAGDAGSSNGDAAAHPRGFKTDRGFVEGIEGDGTDDWSVPPSVHQHPYFVDVGLGSMMRAFEELDKRLIASGQHRLISHKKARTLIGRAVEPGQIGLYSYAGRPVIVTKPGRYFNFSWTHSWCGKRSVTACVDFMGLTYGQVGQGECMVIQSPTNQIFCVRNGGFAAFGAEGRFRIIEVVDTLDLGAECAVVESSTKQTIGWKKEVRARVGAENSVAVNATVATFFNVPVSSVLILQQGERLIELPAGQHVITNPTTTFRGFFSLAERQTTFATKPAYTLEGVPVVLHVNLRYRLAEALLLAPHYNDAFAALVNPAQSAVNAVVSRLSYQQFMRAKKAVASDVPDHDVVPWLDTFKHECMQELTQQAVQYGVVVESFEVLDRQLDGSLGRDLEKAAEAVLQNQMRATQIDLENHIKIETERGKLRVVEVETSQRKALADAEFYTRSKAADAKYYEQVQVAKAQTESSAMAAAQDAANLVTVAEARARQVAKAEAEASALRTQQDADNIIKLATARAREVEMMAHAKAAEVAALTAAYDQVKGPHTASILLSEIDVARTRSLPAGTVYFQGGGGSAAAEPGFMTGFSSAMGAAAATQRK